MSGPPERRIWETLVRQLRGALDAGDLDGLVPTTVLCDRVGRYHDDGVEPGPGDPALLMPNLDAAYLCQRLRDAADAIAAGRMLGKPLP